VIGFLSSLGWEELLLLVVIGILLYGRNLPDAGRSLGRVVAQLRRGFQDFKDQMNRDADLREMKQTFQDTAQQVRRVVDVPRAIRNPATSLQNIAKDALAGPLPEESPWAPEAERAPEAAQDGEPPAKRVPEPE
jgi:sec-independent protein translocase protein TatA